MGLRENMLWLSTHADDMCMAAGTILRGRWQLLPGVPRVVTVVSESDHCARDAQLGPPACGVRSIRKFEDRQFAALVGLELVELGFQDRYVAEPVHLDHALVHKVTARLLALAQERRARWLTCPYPSGPHQHTHHQAVRFAAEAVAKETGATLVYVDDLPYSRLPLEHDLRLDGTRYVPLQLDLTGEDLAWKTAAMWLYRSQMRPKYFEAVRQPRRGDDGPSETIWVPSGAATHFGARLRNHDLSAKREHVQRTLEMWQATGNTVRSGTCVVGTSD